MRLLTRADLESVLTMADTIDVVEDAFREYARGNVRMPLRIAVNMPEYENGMHGVMQGYVGGEVNALAIKAARLGGGKIWVFLFNPEDGHRRRLWSSRQVSGPLRCRSAGAFRRRQAGTNPRRCHQRGQAPETSQDLRPGTWEGRGIRKGSQ